MTKQSDTSDMSSSTHIQQSTPSLTSSHSAQLGFAHIDLDRIKRRGVAEVVFGEGKQAHEIASILYTLYQTQQRALCTRVHKEKFQNVRQKLEKYDTQLPVHYHPQARTIQLGSPHSIHPNLEQILVVSAGTSDGAVAAEAATVLQFLGQPVQRINDVGVAGLHRLLSHVDQLQKASVIIVCAGMEGALASVVAGLVNCPVIAVPTSVGYGANLGGVTTLLAMLNSCAAGVMTVNIDNGFGAAYSAAQINRKLIRSHS